MRCARIFARKRDMWQQSAEAPHARSWPTLRPGDRCQVVTISYFSSDLLQTTVRVTFGSKLLWPGWHCVSFGQRGIRRCDTLESASTQIASPMRYFLNIGLEKRPRFGGQIPAPRMGTRFSVLLQIIIRGQKMVPIWGPESDPQNGAAFRTLRTQKMQPQCRQKCPPQFAESSPCAL